MRLDQFLFCELARKEPSGQFTIVGLIPGNTIAYSSGIQPVGAALVLPTFCCLACFDYMQGVTEIEIQCEVSRGNEIIQRTAPNRERRDNPRARFHTQVFLFAPFVVPGAGEYTFKLVADANGRVQSFHRKLTIERTEGPTRTGTH